MQLISDITSLPAHGNACNACSEGSCPASWQGQRAASVLGPASYPGPDDDGGDGDDGGGGDDSVGEPVGVSQ